MKYLKLCLLAIVVTLSSIIVSTSCSKEDNPVKTTVETPKTKLGAQSFCTEGKKWHYTRLDVSADPKMQPFSFEVRGDTVVGEMSYKKIYRQKDGQEHLAFMMREQGDKVFKLHPNKDEQLFFDFGRDDVGVVYSWNSWDKISFVNWAIKTIDTIRVNDNLFRRYCCYQNYSETKLMTIEGEAIVDYWVKGVGDVRYGVAATGLEVKIRLPGITEYFDSCEVNGECIFTANDFDKPAYTSEKKKVRSEWKDESFYDLRGHRIVTPTKGVKIL